MVTKSKRTRTFSMGSKIFASFVFLMSVLMMFSSVIVYLNIALRWGNTMMVSRSYYQTTNFQEEFINMIDNAVDVHLLYDDMNQLESGNFLERDTVIRSFKNYYGIADGIITKNTEINDTYDGLVIKGKIPEDLLENFNEYQFLVENKLPQYRKSLIQNEITAYHQQARELEQNTNFFYYIEDSNGNKIAGNSAKNRISNMEHSVVVDGMFSSNKMITYYSDYQNEILEKSGCKLYSSVNEPLVKGDNFYKGEQEFLVIKRIVPVMIGVFSLGIVLFFLSLAYLIRTAGQKFAKGPVTLSAVDVIYNDIHLLFVFLCAFISLTLAAFFINEIVNSDMDFWTYLYSTFLGILALFGAVVFLTFVLSITRQFKKKVLFYNTMVAAALRKIGALFSGKIFRGWMLFLFIAYGLVNCMLVFFFCYGGFYGEDIFMIVNFVALIAFNIFSAFFFVRTLRSLTNIMVSAKEISQGNLSYSIDMTEISSSFLNFAGDISNIQNGFKKSVEEAVKGERMKGELITNVSHDLKTPLTSLITYVDLLRHQELNNPVAEGYVDVLNEKSYRLKQLIEDLIEASKASSGNLAVHLEKMDLDLLILQAIGELEEKVSETDLEIKVSAEKDVLIYADGKHMWRIVENMLTNAIKYSMPKSRIYIEIKKTEERGLLIIKNISADVIEVDPEHLTERFVRGQVSRTTEGAGLGLSITKSLSELQGGTFGIHVDGDLFKATVAIPLWMEPETEKNEEEDGEAEKVDDVEEVIEETEIVVKGIELSDVTKEL